MNKSLICTLIVLNLAFSNAVFLKKPSQATFTVFNQLKAVEDVGFGKKILDTIALQLKNKSPLGDIAKMLNEIRSDLTLQQKDSDNLHAQQESECESEINEYTRRIDTATTNHEEATSTIATLNSEISALTGEIKNKGAQLDILNNREVSLTESREQDAADFAQRQSQSVEVVGALELIIEKLSTIEPHEESSVLAELARIGSSNPIMALVEVASTFSPEALEKVVNKLDELRQNLESAIEDDKSNEQAALGEYENLKEELSTTRHLVASAKSDAESRLKQTEGALDIQQKKLEEATEELISANEGKVEKTAQCENWRVKYNTERTSRTAEINVVRDVENIIATKLDTMKDYLKDRVDQDDE